MRKFSQKNKIYLNRAKKMTITVLSGVLVASSVPIPAFAQSTGLFSRLLSFAVESRSFVSVEPVTADGKNIAEETPVAPEEPDSTPSAPTPEEVRAEITRQAELYGVNLNTALRIARCESSFIYNAKSPKSTAKGVYQFIDGTWKWIGAVGHQYDYKENIKQFMIWYKKYPHWWECK